MTFSQKKGSTFKEISTFQKKLTCFSPLLTDWINLDGSHYKFVTDLKPMKDGADTYCQNLGAHLIRLQTEDEFLMIKSIIQQNSG